jgi:hypothetical protein
LDVQNNYVEMGGIFSKPDVWGELDLGGRVTLKWVGWYKVDMCG